VANGVRIAIRTRGEPVAVASLVRSAVIAETTRGNMKVDPEVL